jgi:hypothetical protein
MSEPANGSEGRSKPAVIVDPAQMELFKEFMKLQSEELGLKRQEFDLSLQQQKDAHEMSKLSLGTQERDRLDSRKHHSRGCSKAYMFIGLLALLFLVFIGFCIHEGKEALVRELGQTVVMVVGGGAGGYVLCVSRMSKQSSKQDDSEG